MYSLNNLLPIVGFKSNLSAIRPSVQRVLCLSGPRARLGLDHIGVPVPPIGCRVVHLEHVRGMNLIACHEKDKILEVPCENQLFKEQGTCDDAGGPVAAVETLVESVARLLARRKALLHGVVRYHRQYPRAHFLSVVL